MTDEEPNKAPGAPMKLIDLLSTKSEPLDHSAAPGQIALAEASTSPQAILDAVQDYNVEHVVQKANPTWETSLDTAKIMMNSASEFIMKPLVSILRPTEIASCAEKEMVEFEQYFEKASDKTKNLEKLATYLDGFSKRDTLTRDVLLVADELFTNAIYNAPFVENKVSQQSGVPRGRHDVQMIGGLSGRLFAGRRGPLLILGCEDHYGTLNLKGLVKRIKTCYERGAGQVMNRCPNGGAGIGSWMIFHATNNFYAVVENGERTMICCGFIYESRLAERVSIPKNVHLHGYTKA